MIELPYVEWIIILDLVMIFFTYVKLHVVSTRSWRHHHSERISKNNCSPCMYPMLPLRYFGTVNMSSFSASWLHGSLGCRAFRWITITLWHFLKGSFHNSFAPVSLSTGLPLGAFSFQSTFPYFLEKWQVIDFLVRPQLIGISYLIIYNYLSI